MPSVVPTKIPTELDLAYLAGLFDGEGSVLVQEFARPGVRYGKLRYRFCVHVSMAMTETAGMKVLSECFGGYFQTWSPTRNKTVGRLGKKAQLRWSLNSKKAYEFLTALRPYIRVKAPQVDKAIQFYETFNTKEASQKGQSGFTPEDVLSRRLFVQALRDSRKTAHTEEHLLNEALSQ